jgi:hypothetical protein
MLPSSLVQGVWDESRRIPYLLVQPIRMRVIDAQEFEPPFAEFPHQAHDLQSNNSSACSEVAGIRFSLA